MATGKRLMMKQPRLTLFGVMVLLQNNKASIQVKHQTAPELALHAYVS